MGDTYSELYASVPEKPITTQDGYFRIPDFVQALGVLYHDDFEYLSYARDNSSNMKIEKVQDDYVSPKFTYVAATADASTLGTFVKDGAPDILANAIWTERGNSNGYFYGGAAYNFQVEGRTFSRTTGIGSTDTDNVPTWIWANYFSPTYGRYADFKIEQNTSESYNPTYITGNNSHHVQPYSYHAAPYIRVI